MCGCAKCRFTPARVKAWLGTQATFAVVVLRRKERAKVEA